LGDGSPGIPGLLAGFAPGRRVAGYLIEEQIGLGGMAVVFRAVDERLGRQVALKVLAPALAHDPAFRERFIRESRAAATVDDPHIIPVYEAGEADGILFIAMRLVPGRDARMLLDEEGPLAAARVAAIISPVASALDAAHAVGLVHRDVKPANMLVDARPGRPDHVYLSDFGLSRGTLPTGGLTGSGLFLGTPNYAAPEQIQGRAVDGRADQYGLACTAFELLIGEPPFERDQGMAIIWAHLSEPPPSLCARRAELPAAVDVVFTRALAKTPEDRYPTCGDFADELRAALRLMPYHSGPDVIPVSRLPTMAAAMPLPRRSDPAGSALPEAPEENRPQDADLEQATVTSARADPRMPPAMPRDASPGEWEHDGPDVTTVAFAPDGTTFAAGGSDGSICLRDPATVDVVAEVAASRSEPDPASRSVEAIAYSPDSSLLAAGSVDGSTRLWNLGGLGLVGSLTQPDSAGVNAVAFSPDGTTLACGDENGRIYLWNIRTQAVGAVLANPGSEGVFSVAFSPDGTTLACGDGNGCAYLWDPGDRRLTATLAGSGTGEIYSVAFAPDGTVLATADADGSIGLWDVSTGQQLSALTRRTLRSVSAFAIAFRPRCLDLAAAYGSSGVYVWDTERARPIMILGKHGPSAAYAVAYSPDGKSLVTGHSNGATVLWEAATGRRTRIAVNIKQHKRKLRGSPH